MVHQKAFQTIQKHNLIPPHTLVVVAVSGGADSLALLHLLRELRPRLECTLHVATLDHGLRGAAGEADARFVAATATAWGLPVTIGQANVPALIAQSGQGVEAAARQARYTFLAEVARATGAHIVATAHHADDQAETILLHLLRGSGLRGLRGMTFRAALPGFPDITLVRPLLETSRAAIESYCREHHLTPRDDATNQDTALIRNRIRHDILPQLQTINPQIVPTLINFSESVAVDLDYLDEQFTAIQAACHRESDRISINRPTFSGLHPALQRRFVLWAAEQLNGGETTSHQHVIAAVDRGSRGDVGSQVLLPGGLRLRVAYTEVVVERLTAAAPDHGYILLPVETETPVIMPGITPVPGGIWALVTRLTPPPAASPGTWAALTGGDRLTLRTRRAGDRFAPPGLGGHTKKLNRWLTDQKVPHEVRDRIPLLVVGGQVAAIRLADRWVVSARFSPHEPVEPALYAALQPSP